MQQEKFNESVKTALLGNASTLGDDKSRLALTLEQVREDEDAARAAIHNTKSRNILAEQLNTSSDALSAAMKAAQRPVELDGSGESTVYAMGSRQVNTKNGTMMQTGSQSQSTQQ